MVGAPKRSKVAHPGQLAHLLRTLRERALLTQEQLAERAGVTARSIRDIERGTVAAPRLATVRRIIDALPLLEGEGEAAIAAATTQPPKPPADQTAADMSFTGRAKELKLLSAYLPGSPIAVAAPAAVAIIGPAGSGKTALALHFATLAQSFFPGGTLILSMHAGEGGERPSAAVDAGSLAPRLQVAAWHQNWVGHSLPADGRSLVIADDAVNVEQCEQLMHGIASGGAFVLITSRDRLTWLAARHGVARVALGPLPPSDAASLLARGAGPSRMAAEPSAARALIGWCGAWPGALSQAAAELAALPDVSLGEYLMLVEKQNPPWRPE